MDVITHLFESAGHCLIVVAVMGLCIAAVMLSVFSISGTWIIVLATLLALLVSGSTFPTITTVLVFLGIAAGIEVVEALAGSWGVSRRGGSRFAGVMAFVGGVVGAFAGAVIPIPVIGPLIGMFVCSFGFVFLVEYRRLCRADHAVSIAHGTVVARLLIIVLKVFVTLGMSAVLLIGMFAW